MILSGKSILDEVKQKVIKCIKDSGRVPKFVILTEGTDPASKVYVKNKVRDAKEVGIDVEVVTLQSDTDVESIVKNSDAVILQLPAKREKEVLERIEKVDIKVDVDGLLSPNLGKLLLGEEGVKPCTPYGVMELLKYYGISVAGKNCAVIGRSIIVGKPLALMLLKEDATVTICHSKTVGLEHYTKEADIVFTAVGKKGFIKRDMLKPGSIVVDIGISRDEDGIHGDCDESIKDVVSAYTPVPGGVGLTTRAMLLKNICEVAGVWQD